MDYHAIFERVEARVEHEKRRQRRSMVLSHIVVSLLLPFLLGIILPPGNAVILVVLVISLLMGVIITPVRCDWMAGATRSASASVSWRMKSRPRSCA
jgi:hypothetical protein